MRPNVRIALIRTVCIVPGCQVMSVPGPYAQQSPATNLPVVAAGAGRRAKDGVRSAPSKCE